MRDVRRCAPEPITDVAILTRSQVFSLASACALFGVTPNADKSTKKNQVCFHCPTFVAHEQYLSLFFSLGFFHLSNLFSSLLREMRQERRLCLRLNCRSVVLVLFISINHHHS